MAEVPSVDRGEPITPAAKPLTFDADISDGPKAGESANHLSGSASGYRASYTDLHSFTWWVPEGEILPE